MDCVAQFPDVPARLDLRAVDDFAMLAYAQLFDPTLPRIQEPYYFREYIPNRLRFKILERDGFRCVYCGATGRERKLVMDHIHPVIHGGRSTEENLATACYPCNSAKGGRLLKPQTREPHIPRNAEYADKWLRALQRADDRSFVELADADALNEVLNTAAAADEEEYLAARDLDEEEEPAWL